MEESFFCVSVHESSRTESLVCPFSHLYLVRIRAACLIVNLLLVLCGRRFFQILGEITQCRLADTRCDISVAVRGVIRDFLLL